MAKVWRIDKVQDCSRLDLALPQSRQRRKYIYSMQTFFFILEEQRRHHQSAHPEVFGELTLSVLKLYTFTELVTGYRTLPKWQLTYRAERRGKPPPLTLSHNHGRFVTYMLHTIWNFDAQYDVPDMFRVRAVVPEKCSFWTTWFGANPALSWNFICTDLARMTLEGHGLNQTPLLQIAMWTIQAEYGM